MCTRCPLMGGPGRAQHTDMKRLSRAHLECLMKLFVEYTAVLAGTLLAAALVAFGEPAQADLRMAQAASAEEWLDTASCLR